MRFFATVNQMLGGSFQPPATLSVLCSMILIDYRALGSSQKLGGAAEHLIDGSGKRICRLSFELRVRILVKGTVMNEKLANQV